MQYVINHLKLCSHDHGKTAHEKNTRDRQDLRRSALSEHVRNGLRWSHAFPVDTWVVHPRYHKMSKNNFFEASNRTIRYTRASHRCIIFLHYTFMASLPDNDNSTPGLFYNTIRLEANDIPYGSMSYFMHNPLCAWKKAD